jgi:hypothetical protein
MLDKRPRFVDPREEKRREEGKTKAKFKRSKVYYRCRI